jgi:hypothetical protein
VHLLLKFRLNIITKFRLNIITKFLLEIEGIDCIAVISRRISAQLLFIICYIIRVLEICSERPWVEFGLGGKVR